MKAVIFDMDGTILNTIDDLANAVNYILEKYNMPTKTVDEVRVIVGNGLHRTLELCVAEGTSREFVDSIFDEFAAYYKSHSNINTKPYEGIVEAIRKLKDKGYKLAVVSNKRQEAVEKLCDEFYLGLFDEMFGDQDGMARKPEPDMVWKALDNLGVLKSDAVYIGDSEVDIMTANNSKLKGIYVSWGFRGASLLKESGAEIIVDTTEEMIAAVDRVLV